MLHATKCIEINAPTSQHDSSNYHWLKSLPESPWHGYIFTQINRQVSRVLDSIGSSVPRSNSQVSVSLPQLLQQLIEIQCLSCIGILTHQGGRGWHSSQERWCSSGAQVAGKVRMRGILLRLRHGFLDNFSGSLE